MKTVICDIFSLDTALLSYSNLVVSEFPYLFIEWQWATYRIKYLATALFYFLGCAKKRKLTWLGCIGWIEGESLEAEQQIKCSL